MTPCPPNQVCYNGGAHMGLPGQAVAPLALPDQGLPASFRYNTYPGVKMTTARPDTWMPLYWGDYLRDTGHLSTAEHGAYLLLIGHYWTTGKALPDNDVLLARIARMSSEEWSESKQIILAFFQKRGGLWYHHRVADELEKRKRVFKARSYAGKFDSSKANQNSNKPSTKSDQTANPSSPSPSPSLPSPSPTSPFFPTPTPSALSKGQRPSFTTLRKAESKPINSSKAHQKPNTARENADLMMEMWNELASKNLCLPTVRKLTRLRITQAALRLKEIGGIDVWQEALDKIEISRHCLGDNDRGWVANFDFMLQPSSLRKVLEGNYDDRRVITHDPLTAAALEERARREN